MFYKELIELFITNFGEIFKIKYFIHWICSSDVLIGYTKNKIIN